MFDSFEAHKTEQVKRLLKSENTELSVIPGWLTSVLQSLDVCLNKPFKDRLSSSDESFNDDLIDELFASDSESDFEGF